MFEIQVFYSQKEHGFALDDAINKVAGRFKCKWVEQGTFFPEGLREIDYQTKSKTKAENFAAELRNIKEIEKVEVFEKRNIIG